MNRALEQHAFAMRLGIHDDDTCPHCNPKAVEPVECNCDRPTCPHCGMEMNGI